MKNRILYIEDETLLARIIIDSLHYHNYQVDHYIHGQQIETYLQEYTPDICILDVMLPHIDGFMLGKNIRKILPSLPIIFLTAKNETKDVIEGFKSGGTDYLKKPFSIDELLIRIENQLVLSKPKNLQDSNTIELFDLILHTDRQEIIITGETRKLSFRETQLAALLLSRSGEVITRKEILMKLWGDDSYFNSRNLDVYIRKFRELLSTDDTLELITLKGVGYRLVRKP
ncbi:MAG: response regulator transcription factor [Flavobacteriales bacterium]|jgi:DNA-binding response OmpR family regulator